MKSIFKEKFKGMNFVKPLYRNINIKDIKTEKSVVEVDSKLKLYGDSVDVVKVVRNIDSDFFRNSNYFTIKDNVNLPGICGSSNCTNTNGGSKIKPDPKTSRYDVYLNKNNVYEIRTDNKLNKTNSNEIKESKGLQLPQSNEEAFLTDDFPNTWLRVYPAPKVPGETVLSFCLRCALSQIGLASILILWTLTWMLVIHKFEAEHESYITMDFLNKRNQAVVELATELRQIAPVSPKWREVIEKRIDDERKLAIDAIKNGARTYSTAIWDLSGTFLFTIYLMTTLGFGAPIPQTLIGRISALIFSTIAVPTHLFLVMNATRYVVFHAEAYRQLVTSKKVVALKTNDVENHCINSFVCYTKYKLCNILCQLIAGPYLPITILLYYLMGTVTFGMLGKKPLFQSLLFQVDVTTGFEHVESYVRCLYALYVEGAVLLFACAVTVLRKISRNFVVQMTSKYRLYESE